MPTTTVYTKVLQGACVGATVGALTSLCGVLFCAPPPPPLAYFDPAKDARGVQRTLTDPVVMPMMHRWKALLGAADHKRWASLLDHFDTVLQRLHRFFHSLACLRLYAPTQAPYSQVKVVVRHLGLSAVRALRKTERLAWNHPDLTDLDRIANDVAQRVTDLMLATEQ